MTDRHHDVEAALFVTPPPPQECVLCSHSLYSLFKITEEGTDNKKINQLPHSSHPDLHIIHHRPAKNQPTVTDI